MHTAGVQPGQMLVTRMSETPLALRRCLSRPPGTSRPPQKPYPAIFLRTHSCFCNYLEKMDTQGPRAPFLAFPALHSLTERCPHPFHPSRKRWAPFLQSLFLDCVPDTTLLSHHQEFALPTLLCKFQPPPLVPSHHAGESLIGPSNPL